MRRVLYLERFLFSYRPLSMVLLFFLIVSSFCACDEHSSQPIPHRPQSGAKEIHYKSGSALLSMKINRLEMSVAQTLVLVLKTESPDNCSIDLPSLQGKLGAFQVLNEYDSPPRLTLKGRIARSRTYRLQPLLAGEHTIVSLNIPYYCTPDESNSKLVMRESTMKTDAVLIRVHSLIKDNSKKTLGTILPPVEAASSKRSNVPAILFASSLAAGLLVLIGLRRRRNATATARPPAHEIARVKIHSLLLQNLIEQGEFNLFFQNLQEIIQVYVRQRFDLHSQQATSQEFLKQIDRIGDLSERSKMFLGHFVDVCDQVKFARRRPGQAEVKQIAKACAAFIEDTKALSR